MQKIFHSLPPISLSAPKTSGILWPLNSWRRRIARAGALGCALGLAASAAQAQAHGFTLLDGNTTIGELVAVHDGFVDIKNADGKTFQTDFYTFSAPDQVFIKAWAVTAYKPKDTTATADSAITASISTDQALESAVTGSSILLLPKVVLLNQEPRQNFTGLKGTLILLGQDADGDGTYRVLRRDSFTTDLPALGKFDFSGKALPATDAGPVNSHANYKYKGYFFVLQNAQNETILFKSSDASLDSADAALKLNAGAVYDSQLKPLN
jgi:hypothetical protein